MTHIQRLELAGYQHLTDSYAFGEGLNVVTGANESGKSTLHEALTVALFGFGPEDRRRAGGSSAKDLRRPWTGPPFGAVLSVVDRRGRLVRVRWDFDSDLVEATDAATGRVLLREQPQQRTSYSVGPTLLGLSREDFRQLSCLFQQGLEPVRPSETLRRNLQQAVEMTAGTDGGVDGAEQRLKALLSDMGVHGGHYGATRGGRLARTEAEVHELKQRLDRAKQERLGLEQLAWQRVQLGNQLGQVDGRILDDEQAALRAHAERLAGEHAHAVWLKRALPSTDAGHEPSLPAGLDGRVAAARDDVADAERELEMAQQAAASAAAELAEARDAARRADSSRSTLAAYADVDTTSEEAVRAELSRMRSAAPAVARPAARPPRDPLLERFRAERARVEAEAAAAPAEQRTSGARAMLALAAALAVAGAGGAVAAHPAALVMLPVAVIVAVVALRQRVAPAPATPSVFEGRPLAQLVREAEEEERAWIRHEAALAEYERLVAESAAVREAAETALLRLLGAGDVSTAPLETRADDHLRQCAKHREYENADTVAERAATRARDAAAPAEAVRRAEQVLHDAHAELRRLLERAGIEEDDLDVALNSFDALIAADTTRREEAEQRADASGRLEQLLDGRSVDELAAAAEQAVVELAAHEAAHGHRTGGRVAGASRQENVAAREELIGELADLRARIDERETVMDDPADLELQLEAATIEVGRLHMWRDAARMAREELAAAAGEAHRRVAPHLNAALARTLPRLTRGRYCEAMVGDDLSIRVVAPDTGNVVDVERLSRGTRDQIALIQRLELARLLDPTGGGAPLLLDDCFAHADEHRLPLAVDLLAEVAEHRQVIVFTDDRAVVAAVRTMAATTVLELPDPVPAPVPALRAA